jgi:hypothetical protein
MNCNNSAESLQGGGKEPVFQLTLNKPIKSTSQLRLEPFFKPITMIDSDLILYNLPKIGSSISGLACNAHFCG